jgi:hypothetical protein
MTKPNGHDRSACASKNQSLPLSSRVARGARLAPGGAASDDARDFPSAAGATAPAGMERDTCAEMAPPGEVGKKKDNMKLGKKPAAGEAGEDSIALVDIPPGIEPLAADGPGFVDTMHAHVDLYLACARLVKSTDEKIAQRMVERLLEMSYGKSPSPSSEEPAPIVFDVPSPAKDPL